MVTMSVFKMAGNVSFTNVYVIQHKNKHLKKLNYEKF